jgi:hypothetical protein
VWRFAVQVLEELSRSKHRRQRAALQLVAATQNPKAEPRPAQEGASHHEPGQGSSGEREGVEAAKGEQEEHEQAEPFHLRGSPVVTRAIHGCRVGFILSSAILRAKASQTGVACRIVQVASSQMTTSEQNGQRTALAKRVLPRH